MRTDINIHYHDREYLEFRNSGTYRLWLAVVFSAVVALRKSRGRDKWARSFLFDENNPFVEAVFDQLNIDPDAMRKRVREEVTSPDNL